MNPRLVAVSGPQQGSMFPLSGDSMSIGRDSSNWICITDSSASRKHCLITRDGEQFKISDLESKNGTCLNGIPIRERILQHGDRVEVGESVFLFLSAENENATSSSGVEEGIGAIPTTRLRLEDALYLEPEKLLTSMPLTARIARGLDAILKLSRAFQTIHDSESMRRRMLQSLFEITPAQRASLIQIRSDTEIESIHIYNRNLKELDTPVSRSVIQLVLDERAAFLSNDIFKESKIRSTESLADQKITSLIAVPMLWMKRLQGIVYMDTGDAGVVFDEDHLQLATAIASIGAVALDGLRRLEELERDHGQLIEDLRITHSMIGESEIMKGVYSLIAKVAPTESSILIYGETGTGKELAARAIHLNSPRVGKPFVAINCANLSDSLLESELFGYEKGAFTGAYILKKGKIEIADGGTLFLDEISELPSPLQARLLRVLQEREFERLGGTRPIQVDIRLITATNQDLALGLSSGRFRQDLYYRLNVVQLVLPPLRERKEDIPLLASYFVGKYSRKCGRKINGVSAEARRCLMNYDWPGNVRELENSIERAAVLGSEDVILPEDLPEAVLEISAPHGPVIQYQELLRETKRRLIEQALKQADGNHIQAARNLGMHPNNLHRILRNLKADTE